MIDVHCHLISNRFEKDRDELITQASQQLEAVILSATHRGEAEEALTLSEKYPSFLYVTLGLHPVYAAKISDKELEAYLNFIRRNKSRLVGVGEIGLDYYWVHETSEIQRTKEVFLEFLKLARELDLPAVLHMRDALVDGLNLVTSNQMRKVVFHCFRGTANQAEEITGHGYHISIATNILRNADIKDAVGQVPLDHVVTETDSPYLGPQRKRNVPQNVGLVVDTLAEIWQLLPPEVDEITSRNARALFHIST